MVVYVITIIIYVLVIINLVLSEVLYKEPKNQSFLKNVMTINLAKEKYITANPRHVLVLSILVGVFLGCYSGLAHVNNVEGSLVVSTIMLIAILYLIEITRTISLKEGKLKFSRFLYITKEIDVTQITGMYIYSYNKKFLKSHAYTTKLVVVKNTGEKVKFSLSSLDNRAVLNLMKDTFGINNSKMYIAKMKETPKPQHPVNGEL